MSSERESPTRIVLPDGRVVENLWNKDHWPKKVGDSAFVPIITVIPDPDQPRDTTNITESADHQNTIASIKLHGQKAIITVTTLNHLSKSEREEIKKVHPDARYMIDNGECRYWAIGPQGAGLPVIEVTLREYASKSQRKISQFVANRNQRSMNVPDSVHMLEGLWKDEEFWEEEIKKPRSVAEIARQLGMDVNLAYKYFYLRNLAPELLELTNLDIHKKGQAFARDPAVALSKVVGTDNMTAHDRQCALFEEAQMKGITGATALTDFFEKHQTEEIRAGSEKHQPRRKRLKLERLFDGVLNNPVLLASAEEICHMIDTASDGDAVEIKRKARKACGALNEVRIKIENAMNPTTNETQEPKEEYQDIDKEDEGLPSSTLPDEDNMLLTENEDGGQEETDPDIAVLEKVEEAERDVAQSPKTAVIEYQNDLGTLKKRGTVEGVSYYEGEEDEEQFFENETVSLERFIALSDAGKLRNQVRGQRAPTYLPSEAKVREAIKAQKRDRAA